MKRACIKIQLFFYKIALRDSLYDKNNGDDDNEYVIRYFKYSIYKLKKMLE
jgi:hypothetical protein